MEASSECGVPATTGLVGVGHQGQEVGDPLTAPPTLPLASAGDPQPQGRRVISRVVIAPKGSGMAKTLACKPIPDGDHLGRGG